MSIERGRFNQFSAQPLKAYKRHGLVGSKHCVRMGCELHGTRQQPNPFSYILVGGRLIRETSNVLTWLAPGIVEYRGVKWVSHRMAESARGQVVKYVKW